MFPSAGLLTWPDGEIGFPDRMMSGNILSFGLFDLPLSSPNKGPDVYSSPLILLLRPKKWGIVAAELKRVDAYAQYMDVVGAMRSAWLGEDEEDLRRLAALCEEMEPSSLYARYANMKVHKRECDFWDSGDKTLQKYIKQRADARLIKVIRMAVALDIPILYSPNEKHPLHISDRLALDEETPVTPVMCFHRHDEGTTYRLQVRVGSQLVEELHTHRVAVLTFSPGWFVIDGRVCTMDESFSAQLLLPFISKPSVFIPRRMENDYFRRFILKNVAKVEVQAEGFDIEDLPVRPTPRLVMELVVDGRYILSLRFKYRDLEFAYGSEVPGKVMLSETEDSFRFTRLLRDWQQEQSFASLVRHTGAEMTSAGIIRFPTLTGLVDWLRQHGPWLREQGFDVVQPSDRVYYVGPLSVRQSDTWHGDWLQTDVTVVLGEGSLLIPFIDLRDTILRGEREYMLPSGERLLIPEEWLARYADLLLVGVPKDRGFRRHRSQLAGSPDMAFLRDGEPSPMTRPDSLPEREWQGLKVLRATLRPYQKTGLTWLWRNLEARTGCCLSDEMGLGKTIQTISLLLEYKMTARPARKPMAGFLFTEEEMSGTSGGDPAGHPGLEYRTSLVVAPASVVHNWHHELARFAPSLKVCAYTGDIAKRREKRLNLMRWDVVLTTYRTLLNDIDFLADRQFGIIIFDESQAFKTASSQIHQAVASLRSLHRMALSGTPVENNLGELWSLMNVLNPDLLGTLRGFQRSFVQPIARQLECGRAALLRRLIAPYFLKRTKEEVLTDLPERQDEVVVCPMTESQVSEYAAELSRARNEWLDGNVQEAHRQVHILAAIQRLRKIANGEGKMDVVFEYLENLRGTHHKVLLFSEYVSLLELVGERMRQRGWTFDLLTGKTQHREQVIAHFQGDEACQFFLISLKAGGVGLNLTAADYVFILDPWWNQAAEEQAIARSHRIGQHHPVFVYRFVSEGTLEQQILTLQERKRSLIDSVMPFICKHE